MSTLVRKFAMCGFGVLTITAVALAAQPFAGKIQSEDFSNPKIASGNFGAVASGPLRLAYEDNAGTSMGADESSSSSETSSSSDGSTSSDAPASTETSPSTDDTSSSDGSSDESSPGPYGKPAKNVAMGIRG